MQEQEYPIKDGSLYFEKTKQGIVITRFHGLAGEIEVPHEIGDCPVIAIAKKAFLSKKQLRRVWLPDTIEEIGEWAFAYCDRLEEVVLPKKNISFGRALFLECKSLRRVVFRELGNRELETAHLMAAALTAFDAYYFLDAEAAGGEEWLGKWDSRLLAFLHTDDLDGYAKQVLCGEEDYGSTDVEAFLNEKRKSKVRLLYLRLLNPIGITEAVQRELEQYLMEHTAGCTSEEAWEVILEEHGNNLSYYQLFTKLGCVTEKNLEQILGDIGERYPEMKAYFLRWKEEQLGTTDFFESLSL